VVRKADDDSMKWIWWTALVIELLRTVASTSVVQCCNWMLVKTTAPKETLCGKDLPGRLAVDVRLNEGVSHVVGGVCGWMRGEVRV
jgi:hypothetical protein